MFDKIASQILKELGAQVSITSKHFILKDRVMLYILPNSLHNVKNIGIRRLKYLYITAPAT